MSRATASLSRLARPFSTTASIAQRSGINGSNATANTARKQDLRSEGRPSETQDATTRSISTRTKTRPVPTPGRTVPLMQTFRTSAPRPTPAAGPATIDCAVLPPLSALSTPAPEPVMRIPLLPDTVVAATSRLPEAADPPLAAPEILVVAADPSRVAPSALTEVGGMGVDGVELRFVHEAAPEAAPQQGMLRDLWGGLVDDVFGEKPKPAAG